MRHAERLGYYVVREYVDDAISGDATEKRIAFQEMVRDASTGSFDCVLCWDQDRFGRFDALEAGYWIKPLRDNGIVLETIAQGRIDWTDFAGRIVWSVTQEGKHAFLRDLARNCARGCRESYEKGVYPGRAPFGYRKENKRLIHGPPDEVAAVRRIFDLRRQGFGARSISLAMAHDGFPHPCRGWSIATVRNILSREAYTGCTVVGSIRRAKYERLYDGVRRFEATHEPIIDRLAWLETRKTPGTDRPKTKRGKPVAPFSGLLKCGLCGSLMHCATYRGEFGYICGNYKLARGCVYSFLPEQTVASRLAERIVSASGKTIEETERRISEIQSRGAVAPGTAAELERLNRQIATATDRVLTVNDSVMPQLRAKINELVTRRDILQAQQLSQQKKPSPIQTAKVIHSLPDLIRHADRASLRGLAIKAMASPAVVRLAHVKSTPRREYYTLESLVFSMIPELS